MLSAGSEESQSDNIDLLELADGPQSLLTEPMDVAEVWLLQAIHGSSQPTNGANRWRQLQST